MRNQLFLLFIFTLLLSSCPPQENKKPNSTGGEPVTTVPPTETTPKPIPPFEMEIPKGYTLLTETSGDLNEDGIDEKVVVLNNGIVSDFGEERTIFIFKADNGAWKMWERATEAILPSDNGGMMGDPFQSIKIENGALVINHFGGSRSKWEYTHRFRFQNEQWELIGATSIVYSACEEQQTFDYNLSSGNVIYKDERLTCENGENEKVKDVRYKVNFNHKKSALPTLDGFDPTSVYAVNQVDGMCIPEGSCYEYQKIIDENSKKHNGLRYTSMSDLQGTYTLGGHDESWVVDIQPKTAKNKQVYYEITYHAIEGMLPPSPSQKEILDLAKSIVIKKFDVDFAKMTFNSDIGKGKIGIDENSNTTLTFQDIESHIADELVVTFKYGYGYDH
ncbi:MAG: hypothetical protein AB8F94_29810 [Saprospiraceae bacterium]